VGFFTKTWKGAVQEEFFTTEYTEFHGGKDELESANKVGYFLDRL